MTKVLLFNPPAKGGQSRDGRCQTEGDSWISAFPPTTFAAIAGCVRERYGLKVMDCVGSGMEAEAAIREAAAYSPDYLVLNTSTPTIDSDLRYALEIKRQTGARVVAYGENVTARHEKLLADGSIDFAVLGEPETPVQRILEGDIRSPGVASKGWDGGLWIEPDLDVLPFPAYDLLPPYYYPLTGERWMFVRTGRGCPHQCIFCIEPTNSPKPRHHSVEYLIKQFKWLSDELKIRLFMFWEETSTLDRQHMIQLCARIRAENLRFKWFCTTRADRFDDGLAESMRAAGCRMVAFGFESGNQEVLDLNKKGITLEQSRNAVKAARKNGLMTIGHFIIGLIGDTPERAKQTARFARELGLDFAQFYVATPYPGSRFHEIAMQNHWLVAKDQGRIQQGVATVSYPDFTAEQMQRERRNAFLRFYIRPQAIYSSIKARSAKGILTMPLQALKFSRWALK